MVFSSAKSGGRQVYLTHFPDISVQRQISVETGSNPIWRNDEIFYTSGFQNEHFVVKVKINQGQISVGQPKRLFDSNQVGVQLNDWYNYKYTVSSDGQEIITVFAPQANTFYYVLVDNWFEEFRGKNINPDEKHVHPEHHRD